MEAEIKTIDTYEVISNTEFPDGSAVCGVAYVCNSHDLASKLAKIKYGKVNHKVVRVAYFIDGTAYQLCEKPFKLISEDPEDVKRRALNKLTLEEKEALGLNI
jgi:hypothetical protein